MNQKDDTFDTLMVQKPINLENPPKIEVPEKASMDDFEKTVASFHRDSRCARTSRQSAQEFSNLIEDALAEVQDEISANDT